MVIGAGSEPLRAACDAAGLRPGSSVPQIDSLQVARLAGLTIATGLPPEPLLPLYVAPAFLGPSRT